MVGTDLRLVALVLVVDLPAVLLPDPDGGRWASAAVWALALLVALSSTSRSLRAWSAPSGGSKPGVRLPSEPADPEAGPPVLREAMGGVR